MVGQRYCLPDARLLYQMIWEDWYPFPGSHFLRPAGIHSGHGICHARNAPLPYVPNSRKYGQWYQTVKEAPACI